jgi:phosphoglucomutase
MTARSGRDPGELYRDLVRDCGEPFYERIDAPATREQKAALQRLSAQRLALKELAGDPVRAVLDTAPGNNAPIGGVKVLTDNGWFAARPSGTEEVYKLYAESFVSPEHLRRIQDEARGAIAKVLAP